MVKAKAVRLLKADENIEERAKFLLRVANTADNNNTVSVRTPPCIAARCGHKALQLHYQNSVNRQRLLSRQDVKDLCPYCGASVESVCALPLTGKALRSCRKHLRSRNNSHKKKKILLKATSKVCGLCGNTIVYKTFKQQQQQQHTQGSKEKLGGTLNGSHTNRLMDLKEAHKRSEGSK